ncbi:hypothetical protein GPECTOR_7g1050 [Gonium pectorale]|uniref:Uncharacterized protein n=1 Tax=Gonium pectorale TaxID=33097 RepID=A0A150GTZ1_GONPE|nr:hypothetical protein GPECTOR_7g1050 [Gonium pectorale]|eukprot:KXZ53158.1 hypothetical protein GPECTOR_7g1050 [Gonium pectorale]
MLITPGYYQGIANRPPNNRILKEVKWAVQYGKPLLAVVHASYCGQNPLPALKAERDLTASTSLPPAMANGSSASLTSAVVAEVPEPPPWTSEELAAVAAARVVFVFRAGDGFDSYQREVVRLVGQMAAAAGGQAAASGSAGGGMLRGPAAGEADAEEKRLRDLLRAAGLTKRAASLAESGIRSPGALASALRQGRLTAKPLSWSESSARRAEQVLESWPVLCTMPEWLRAAPPELVPLLVAALSAEEQRDWDREGRPLPGPRRGSVPPLSSLELGGMGPVVVGPRGAAAVAALLREVGGAAAAAAGPSPAPRGSGTTQLTLTRVDLTECGLGTAGAGEVLAALTSCPSVEVLLLGSNGIEDGISNEFTTLMRRTTAAGGGGLKSLGLDHNALSDRGAASIVQVLYDYPGRLTSLDLSGNPGLGAATAEALSRVLSRRRPGGSGLSRVSLTNAGMDDASLAVVLPALLTAPTPAAPTNGHANGGAAAVGADGHYGATRVDSRRHTGQGAADGADGGGARSLHHQPTTAQHRQLQAGLRSLDLTDAGINASNAVHLAEFVRLLPGLEALTLDFNALSGGAGAAAAAADGNDGTAALFSELASLPALSYLSLNYACDYGAMLNVGEALLPPPANTPHHDPYDDSPPPPPPPPPCPALRVLSLVGCPLDGNTARRLARSLAHAAGLCVLRLGGGDPPEGVGPIGSRALGEALMGHRGLVELSLAGVGLTDNAAKLFAEALPQLPQLSTLDLSNNSLTSWGVEALASALMKRNFNAPTDNRIHVSVAGNRLPDELQSRMAALSVAPSQTHSADRMPAVPSHSEPVESAFAAAATEAAATQDGDAGADAYPDPHRPLPPAGISVRQPAARGASNLVSEDSIEVVTVRNNGQRKSVVEVMRLHKSMKERADSPEGVDPAEAAQMPAKGSGEGEEAGAAGEGEGREEEGRPQDGGEREDGAEGAGEHAEVPGDGAHAEAEAEAEPEPEARRRSSGAAGAVAGGEEGAEAGAQGDYAELAEEGEEQEQEEGGGGADDDGGSLAGIGLNEEDGGEEEDGEGSSGAPAQEQAAKAEERDANEAYDDDDDDLGSVAGELQERAEEAEGDEREEGEEGQDETAAVADGDGDDDVREAQKP